VVNNSSSETVAPIELDLTVTLEEAIAIGIRRLRERRFAAAEAVYRAVLAIVPEHADALHFLGVLRHQLGQREAAIDLIHRAIAAAPGYADAHSNLGNLYKEQGELEKARQAYGKAIEINPAHIGAYNNLGVTMRALGHADAAVEIFLKALELSPENADILQNLGNAYRSQKKYVEAIGAYRRTIGIRPYNRDAYKYLAITLYYMNEPEEAVSLLRQWIAFDPDNPAARHLLAAHTGDQVPDRASDPYVRELFDDFAASFDQVLQNINYRAPELIGQRVARVFADTRGDLQILDAGCGTGLCGMLLRRYARRLVGVDLSPGMLAKARARDVYDELVERELTDYLASAPHTFDLIVSADTLCYFGRLDAVLAVARGRLAARGWLIFTLEKAEPPLFSQSFHLGPHGRYSHGEDYVRTAVSASGFEIIDIATDVLRQEMQENVAGLVLVARPATDGLDPFE
jgi:predicted TPR repeat methyltransferase